MGRELDNQIATALGYHVEHFKSSYDRLVSSGTVWITDPSRKDEPPEKRQDVTINPIPYSTDLRLAWALVEILRDQWTAATEGASDLNLPGHFRSFIAPFDDGAFFDVLHRNADRRWPWAFLYVTPEAICRAFLAAIETDEA